MSKQAKLEYIKLLEDKAKLASSLAILENLKGATREDANKIYDEALEADDKQTLRLLCQDDLFFLLSRACKRKDMDRDWLYDRCREVEREPNGYLDLWSREFYKSTIITFGLSIKDILKNPDVLIGIFSHTRNIAKGFVDQIKRELETNEFLKKLFPDVLYEKPQVEAPKWSLDSGIIVKRKSNPKESTVEAWGVVDSQPTSKHFTVLVYDDLVTLESVSTPEQIKKTTQSLEVSYNLGAKGGVRRFIGTRYHSNDTYRTLMERGSVIPRVKPATHDGTMEGTPVFLTAEELAIKRRDQGPYSYSCQMLQNPVADKAMGFKEEWLKFYEKADHAKWNLYLLVDPAGKKKTTSDYTVMLVVGLAPDNNYYLIDGIRDRLNLTKRAEKLFEFHRKYPIKNVGYEQYGMQADIEHMKYEMEQQNYRFNIVELGGSVPKVDRIQKLIPVFEQSRMWFPKSHTFINYEAKVIDLVKTFIDDEYSSFPVSTHDDMLDCMARILEPDLNARFPKPPPKKVSGNLGRSIGFMG